MMGRDLIKEGGRGSEGCDCCGSTWYKRLRIEHCHRSGYTRGATCDSCNRYMHLYEHGRMNEDHEMWEVVEAYLFRAWITNPNLKIKDYPLPRLTSPHRF